MSLADQAPAAPRQLLMGADTEKVRRLIRTVGWTLIAAQLAGLIAWSTYAYSRGAMSWDFAAYYQPWWSIAHGHLNPAATVMPGGYPFWKNDGEFIIWLLAPLYWLFPNHQLGLWWLQDLALAGISVVCFRWIGELLPWDQSKPLAANIGPAVGWLLHAAPARPEPVDLLVDDLCDPDGAVRRAVRDAGSARAYEPPEQRLGMVPTGRALRFRFDRVHRERRTGRTCHSRLAPLQSAAEWRSN